MRKTTCAPRSKATGITIERRSLEPDPRSVELTSPSDAVRGVDLVEDGNGLATASLLATEPGIYRISDGERTALAVVGAVNPPELADVRTTGDRMEPAAAVSGGGIHWLADGEMRRAAHPSRPRPDRTELDRAAVQRRLCRHRRDRSVTATGWPGRPAGRWSPAGCLETGGAVGRSSGGGRTDRPNPSPDPAPRSASASSYRPGTLGRTSPPP